MRLDLDNGKNVLLPVLLEAGVSLPISAGPGPNLDTIAAELPPTLPVNTPRATLYKKDVARREVLVARLEQAMAYSRQHEKAKLNWDLLDQRGDTIAAWKGRLQKLLRPDTNHRDVDIADAELLGVVEDETALPERRIVAAVAISTSVNKMTRKRILLAVESCADEDVRAAIEAAAERELKEWRLTRLRSRS